MENGGTHESYFTRGKEVNILTRLESVVAGKSLRCEQLKDTSNMDELKEMTDKLGIHRGDIPVYKEDSKGITEIGIYENGIIDIRHIVAKRGVIFPMYIHAFEKAIIAISDGRIEFTMHGLTVVYEKGDFILIKAGEIHEMKALEDTSILTLFLKVKEGMSHEQH